MRKYNIEYNAKIINAIVVFLATLSLYFSFTNFVYLSAVGSLLIVFFFYYLLKRKFLVDNVAFFLILYYLICIISSIIVQPKQLLEFSFYRRDGNVFITFAPLLILTMCDIKFNLWKNIKYLVFITSCVNVPTMIYYFMTRPTPEYNMLFTAHNAAGGFLSVIVIFNIALIGRYGWKPSYFLALFINLLALYFTNSRGSLLPLAGALIYFLIEKKIKKVDIFLNICIFIGSFLMVAYISSVRLDDTLINLSGFTMPQEFLESSMLSSVLSMFNRSWTMIDRLYYLWPRAVYLFFQSPIFGVGFGAFNDVSYNLEGFRGIFMLNLSPEIVNSDSHAHNSYFHILAETGIVGISIIVMFLLSIRKCAVNAKDKDMKFILFTCLNFAILSSFFEHRLFTPSQMLPFTLLLGMYISTENSYKYEERRDPIYDLFDCNSNQILESTSRL